MTNMDKLYEAVEAWGPVVWVLTSISATRFCGQHP